MHSRRPRIGGYVIHGNARETLGVCLDDLVATCDDVVAIDTGSHDGSDELVRQRGVRSVRIPWRGYGDARARAVENLTAGFDYVFFLDSDERLAPNGVEALRAWQAESPQGAVYQLVRQDWVTIEGRRFVFRSAKRKRLLRADCALWNAKMIVHEAIRIPAVRCLPATIEHAFVPSLAALARRSEKYARYALLSALRAHLERRTAWPPAIAAAVRALRDTIGSGAVFRGGSAAFPVLAAEARLEFDKYRMLKRLRRGEFPELVEFFNVGDYDKLFAHLSALTARP